MWSKKKNSITTDPTCENLVKYQCQNSKKYPKFHCFANVLSEWRTRILSFAKQFSSYVMSF